MIYLIFLSAEEIASEGVHYYRIMEEIGKYRYYKKDGSYRLHELDPKEARTRNHAT